MPRRKRRQRAAAKARPRRAKEPSGVGVSLEPSLRQRFPEGLPPEPEPEPEPPPPRQVMTEAEVMEAAFRDGSFDPEEVEIVEQRSRPAKKKAVARARTSSGVPQPEPVGPAPVDPEVIREREAFASRQASVQEFKERSWAPAGWSDAPLQPPADRAALSDEERRIITAARRSSPPTLRLRGLRRSAALEALCDFVSLHHAAGRRYVRVVTGKGIGSPGEPVLKHSFVAWCAGEGALWVRGYAPDRDMSLEFGAFILALRRPGKAR